MTGQTEGLSGIDVAILCGGFGTRVASVLGDTPKVLASVRGRPFLDHMAEWLKGFGARRVVLCIGHLANKVQDYVAAAPLSGLNVEVSVEPEPLGTGGAIRHCAALLCSDPVLIMNGDSWTSADLNAFVADFRRQGASVGMLCVPTEDASRYGRVDIGTNGTVTAFVEKDPDHPGAGIINAGIYLLSRQALHDLLMTRGPSFERDFLARLPAGSLYASLQSDVAFIDIGTPESLFSAGDVLACRGGDALDVEAKGGWRGAL